MATEIEFELEEGIAQWGYEDETFVAGEKHTVSANAELRDAIGAAAAAGSLKLHSPKSLAKDAVESDKDSLEKLENLSDDQIAERKALAKLSTEHDRTVANATLRWVDEEISDEELDEIATESGQRLWAATKQVTKDKKLRDKLAVDTGRRVSQAVDLARELMGTKED